MGRQVRKWSDAERETALAIFADEGCTVASTRTGIPKGTIFSWAHRTSKAVDRAAGVELVPSSVPWPERRARMIPELVAAAGDAVTKSHEAIQRSDGRTAKDLAVAAGILIDKAELLAGRATRRTESAQLVVHAPGQSQSAMRAEMARLRAELALEDERPDDAA